MQWITPNNLQKLQGLNNLGSIPTVLAAGYLNCHPSTLSKYSNLLLKEFREYLLWKKRDKAYRGKTLQLITMYRAIACQVNQQETFEILWDLLLLYNYEIADLCEAPHELNDLINKIHSPTKAKTS